MYLFLGFNDHVRVLLLAFLEQKNADSEKAILSTEV